MNIWGIPQKGKTSAASKPRMAIYSELHPLCMQTKTDYLYSLSLSVLTYSMGMQRCSTVLVGMYHYQAGCKVLL